MVRLLAAAAEQKIDRGRKAIIGDAALAVRRPLLGERQPLVRPRRSQVAVHRHLRLQPLPRIVAEREEDRRPPRRRIPDRRVCEPQTRAQVVEAVGRHPAGLAAAAAARVAPTAAATTASTTAASAPGAAAVANVGLVGIGWARRAGRQPAHGTGFLGGRRAPRLGRLAARDQQEPGQLPQQRRRREPRLPAQAGVTQQVPLPVGPDQHAIVTQPQVHDRRHRRRRARRQDHGRQVEAQASGQRLHLAQAVVRRTRLRERRGHGTRVQERPQQRQRLAPARDGRLGMLLQRAPHAPRP